MTQEDLEVLAAFGAVWERVSGERMDSAADLSVAWEELLTELFGYWRGCVSLAVWAVGAQRKRLLRLAAEAEGVFRMAQTEYFLETGDIFQTHDVKNFASYTPYNLRNLYKNAVNLAELLQKGETACSVSVGDAWERMERHANVLKELLGECLQ